MKDFLGFLLLFAIFGIVLYSFIGSLGVIHSANVGDCAPNENGTLENCSLSDQDYALLNKTGTVIGQTAQIESIMMWVLLLGVLVSGFLLLRRTHK
jgi:hypothetical protein